MMTTINRFFKNEYENFVLMGIAVIYYTYIANWFNLVVIDNNDLIIFYDSLRTIRYVTLAILFILLIINIIYETIAKTLSFKFIILSFALVIFLFFVSYRYEYVNSNEYVKNYYEFPTLVFFNILTRKVDYKKIIKCILIVFLVTHSANLISILIGTTYNRVVLRVDDVRYSLGLGNWPSVFSISFMYICLYYVYLRCKTIKLPEIFILVLLMAISHYITSTRSIIIIDIILLLFVLVCNYTKIFIKFNKAYMVLFMFLILILPIFAIAIHYFYTPDIKPLSILNNILQGRLQLGQSALLNNGITLFGTDYQVVGGENYNVIDASYLKFLINYGLIAFALLYATFAFFGYCIYKNNDIVLSFVLLLSMIHMCFDLDLFYMSYNNLLFVASYANSKYRY